MGLPSVFYEDVLLLLANKEMAGQTRDRQRNMKTGLWGFCPTQFPLLISPKENHTEIIKIIRL